VLEWHSEQVPVLPRNNGLLYHDATWGLVGNVIEPNQREGSNVAAAAVAGVFLAIEGPIGVGKTTLARLLHERWMAELVLEHFDENPFLPLFYADRQRYAWQTQLHFLIDRFDQWSELRPTALRVSDYLFDKDRVFAELNLDDVALRRYLKVFHALHSQLRQPTGVIYLHADVDILLARIAARARSYEQQIDRTYLQALADAYKRFFATYTEAPVLAWDMTGRDLLHNTEDCSAVLAAIQVAFGVHRS
jgi:deoxyadenosine/deoxycytidine kinase